LGQVSSGSIRFSSSLFQAAHLLAQMMPLTGCSRTSMSRLPLLQSTSPTQGLWAKMFRLRSHARQKRLKAENTQRTLCSSLQALSFQKQRNWPKIMS
jgi:hypothetical protein